MLHKNSKSIVVIKEHHVVNSSSGMDGMLPLTSSTMWTYHLQLEFDCESSIVKNLLTVTVTLHLNG